MIINGEPELVSGFNGPEGSAKKKMLDVEKKRRKRKRKGLEKTVKDQRVTPSKERLKMGTEDPSSEDGSDSFCVSILLDRERPRKPGTGGD